MKIAMTAFVTAALLTGAAGCDQQAEVPDTADRMAPATFLSERLGETGLARVSEPRVFADTALWEYINGGADLYLGYNFEEVATADYRQNGVEITVDIYAFDDAEGAFGLYSQRRPENPTVVQYGVEGYASIGTVEFVKGPYVVTAVGFDDTQATTEALTAAAAHLSERLPGATDAPPTFSLFPIEDALAGTDAFHNQGFIGRTWLSDIYVRKYDMGEDTITCFLSDAQPGATVLEWAGKAEERSQVRPASRELPYDDEKAFVTTDPRHGDIIVGIKGQFMVGMVGFEPAYAGFLAEWLESLP